MTTPDRTVPEQAQGTGGGGPDPYPCDNCGRPCWQGPTRGWCSACYSRWYRAGRPADAGPPDPRNGPARSAAAREDCAWLIASGLSLEEAAARVGIAARTVRRYLKEPPVPPGQCGHPGCTGEATHWRRWCQDHADTQARYLQARADGLSRAAAARYIGIHPSSTYLWEPARPHHRRTRTSPKGSP
ncbi:helix-turn-helix transcriptional regulator [Actinomadura rupiterrae]|uniref:helix-turn-helix transcriptional regulator n=1 Tax=Actinomadura rupiterrae TaxID=559627 RepID=UPI0020A4C572|nr:hypothetical protein [Actinomadura rupiterrae]MCP2337888.1 hypothetical protein [Actinomadura rupiterrae]